MLFFVIFNQSRQYIQVFFLRFVEMCLNQFVDNFNGLGQVTIMTNRHKWEFLNSLQVKVSARGALLCF